MTKKVIVIDDEPGIRTMIQFELSAKEFDVVIASSGMEALKVLEKEPVDLVITDMRMPVMDGLDTAFAIKKLDANVPIILMTGYVEDRVEKVLELKNVKFLQKPFSLDELMEIVETTFPPPASSSGD